jgi:hypothetical protein
MFDLTLSISNPSKTRVMEVLDPIMTCSYYTAVWLAQIARPL